MREDAPQGPDLVRCWRQKEPARKLVNLANVPVLVVQTEASYHAPYDHCTVDYLRKAGVSRTNFVRLADVGIKGNGHMLMLEKNNQQIISVAEKWLDTTLPSGSTPK
ncbi:MAG: alpha/beta-hydrolase [Hyphomicrobiales bacterium]|nr:alpha/beta-hydrolase [Hyphomicrobiales bacterium]